jgi:hypothetical protein
MLQAVILEIFSNLDSVKLIGMNDDQITMPIRTESNTINSLPRYALEYLYNHLCAFSIPYVKLLFFVRKICFEREL